MNILRKIRHGIWIGLVTLGHNSMMYYGVTDTVEYKDEHVGPDDWESTC